MQPCPRGLHGKNISRYFVTPSLSFHVKERHPQYRFFLRVALALCE
jgi:hypothetical protein